MQESQHNVAQQAKLLDSAGTAWHAVKWGRLEQITRLFPSQCNVYALGPVGENVFHIALLLNTPSTLAIAKYLVKLYGKTLVNTPYQERRHELDPPGLYEGETALHIAIVNKDFDMVKFLIQAGGDVRARCFGTFFNPGSQVFYGEYPLSFAVSTGQKDIVSYLRRHGARVNSDTDMYGNTALHLAVYHGQLEMYDHLTTFCGAGEHVRNNRCATPLVLAAALGKLEVFQNIYNRRRRVTWAYGPVTSYSLSLYEIDTVQTSHSNFVPSALETIVRKGHMHMMADPLVNTLLKSKWHRFAAAQFVAQALWYLVLVVVQTFTVWCHCHGTLYNSYSREALEITGVVMAIGVIALELYDLGTWTRGVHYRRSLMMANPQYAPSLYPIPGNQVAQPQDLQKPKTGFNIFKSRAMKGGPVAEATEQLRPTPSAPPRPWVTQSASVAQAHPVQQEVHQMEGWWSEAYEDGACQPQNAELRTCAGPVAEGDGDGQDTNVAGNMSGGREDGIGSSPFRNDGMAGGPPHDHTAFSRSNSKQSPQLLAGLASGRSLTSRQPSMDIVSVGLSALTPGVSRLRTLSVLTAPTTSMLTQPRTADVSQHLGQGSRSAAPPLPAIFAPPSQQYPEVVPASDANPGGVHDQSPDSPETRLNRDGDRPSAEIRNRVRAGGSCDMPAGMANNRRADTSNKRNHSSAGDDLPSEDERQPLHVGGVRGGLRTLRHSFASYGQRQKSDPITLFMMAHTLLTLTHFITWAATYKGGEGPARMSVREFDDIILALVALVGWISLLYFARGVQAWGELSVILELCVWEVIKWCSLYFFFNIGFCLAFYVVLNGVTSLSPGGEAAPDAFGVDAPFSSIGYGMMQLLRFMYGEAQYDAYSATPYRSKKALATVFFILYICCVILLLGNMLTAVIVHVYAAQHGPNNTGHAQKKWRLRWACYVLRAEARLPLAWQQHFRLGQVSYDPALQIKIYNHVFEVITKDKESPTDVADKEIKVLERILEKMNLEKAERLSS